MTLRADATRTTGEANDRAAAEPADTGPVRGRSRSGVTALRILVLVVLLAADTALVAAWGAFQAIETPLYHLDGAFQTASGLLRLHAGDLPGRDFFPYLGIGPVFLLYPAFAVTGGLLANSVFSAWATTAALLALLVGVVLALALRLRSVSAVLGGAGLLLLVLVLGEGRFTWAPPQVQALLAPFFQLGIPGNSLRPVRAAAPLLLIVVTVAALTRLPRLRGIAVTGAAFGIVVACWSNDFALAPSAVVLAFIVHYGMRARGWRLRELGVLAAAVGVAFVASGLATTGGHYAEYAAYNFRDVLGDQSWYFGAWSRQFRVYSPADLIGFISQLGALPGMVLLLGLAVLVLVRPTLRWTAIAALGWAAFAGGTVAMIGGHFDDYFLPFRVWAVVAGTGVVLAIIRRVGSRLLAAVPDGPRRATTTIAAAVAVALVVSVIAVGAVKEVRSQAAQRAFAASDPNQVFMPRLGGYLPTSFQSHLEQAPAAGTFVEEYAGLWTALQGPNQRQKVDAVIHALGTERIPFTRALLDPVTTTAVTTAPQMSAEWVSWNLSANWWFYRELLHRFTPTVDSPNTVVWRRASGAGAPDAGRCAVAPDGRSVTATPSATGLNELTIDYRGPGRGKRAFSMIQNGIDGALDADGYVALDPGAARQSVPIHVANLEPKRYGLRDVPGGRVTTITGCSVATVPFPAGSTAEALYAPLWATDSAPLPLTDGTYENGLGRTFAGFVVNRSAPNIADYRVGQRVRLADGTIRTITESTPNYNVLAVYLDGDPLDQRLLTARAPFTPVG